jgi:hypothetical protein
MAADTTMTASAVARDVATVVTSTGGTAINDAHQVRVAYPTSGKLALIVTSAHNDTELHFEAGDYTAAGVGDLEIGVTNGVESIIIVSDDRLKNDDGYLYWHYNTNSAGYVKAITLPN